MTSIPFAYEIRYQGVHIQDADANAYIELDGDEWRITRITLDALTKGHEVDLLPADFAAERARLYRDRGFCEDAEDIAHDMRAGRIYAHRATAAAFRVGA